MAKKQLFTNKTLGILLIAGLIIQYVLPQIRLGQLSWIATALYLFVAIILFIR